MTRPPKGKEVKAWAVVIKGRVAKSAYGVQPYWIFARKHNASKCYDDLPIVRVSIRVLPKGKKK